MFHASWTVTSTLSQGYSNSILLIHWVLYFQGGFEKNSASCYLFIYSAPRERIALYREQNTQHYPRRAYNLIFDKWKQRGGEWISGKGYKGEIMQSSVYCRSVVRPGPRWQRSLERDVPCSGIWSRKASMHFLHVGEAVPSIAAAKEKRHSLLGDQEGFKW